MLFDNRLGDIIQHSSVQVRVPDVGRRAQDTVDIDVHMDLVIATHREEPMWLPSLELFEKPMRQIELGGVKVWAPEQDLARAHLARRYGPTWREPGIEWARWRPK